MKKYFRISIISLSKWKYPFFLFIFLIVAYLPVASFAFALKNDAFIYNFPNKYFFSEALKHGYIPVWNPYLNYGFPIYADPGFAWWHPITWIFGLIGYNAYSFTIELLLYVYIAGLSMYCLTIQLGIRKKIAFLVGSLFMCSGFFIGNLQHINFITCAAFLPLVVDTWLNLQNRKSAKTLLAAIVSLYLLVTGGHPAIPIATFYFLLIISLFYYLYNKKRINFLNFFIWNAAFLVLSLIILLPPLYSWFTLLPSYSRSEVINQATQTHLGFTIPSYLSFLWPIATVKNSEFFKTDISMRNGYFSTIGFIALLLVIPKKKNGTQIIFFIGGLFMLLLSAGGFIKEVLYEHLPLLQFIRTNGEYRVFTIFSFLIIISFQLENLYNDISQRKLFSLVLRSALVGLFIIFLVLFFLSLHETPLLVSNFGGSILSGIKSLIDNLTFIQSLVVAALLSLLLLICYYLGLKRTNSTRWISSLIMFDLIINTWLMLPFTGVGKTNVRHMQALINKSPHGFPAPSLNSNPEQVPITREDEKLIGNWGWYSKQILHQRTIDYPSILKSTEQFIHSKDTLSIQEKPFIFTKHGSTPDITIRSFTPNSMELQLQVKEKDTLVVLQNNFKGWSAKINNQKVPILSYKNTFIALPITTATQTVTLLFSPFP